MVTKAQKKLKDTIAGIHDEQVIEKIRIFIMGMFAQKRIEQREKPSSNKSA